MSFVVGNACGNKSAAANRPSVIIVDADLLRVSSCCGLQAYEVIAMRQAPAGVKYKS